MATITASPPTMSPPMNPAATSPPSLPPLITSTNTPRRTSSQRPTSWTSRRISSYSSTSRASQTRESRPVSHVFPAFHSSLPYTLVRDFAYPANHPMHYGPPPNQSGMTTPASEVRRLSDPVMASWEDSRYHWSATPPWMSETQEQESKDRLPAMSFQDGGPPYSEDEDLHSPIVTTSRHKKHKSSLSGFERGRSPGDAGRERGSIAGMTRFDDQNGPGGAVLSYPHEPHHRDSNFAKPINRNPSPYQGSEQLAEEEVSEAEDDTRLSKDYSFTIASPDEEMHGKAVALFDFESEHENELALKEGQIILVSFRASDGWLVGEDPRTGETGLVPETFVRLVRDIEGGLNGLNAVTNVGTLDESDSNPLSPVSNEPASATTPTPGQMEFSSKVKHPPVQSTFSTSSKDFSPQPSARSDDEASPPGHDR